MDKVLLEWVKSNRRVSLESPRRAIFHTKTQRFKIIRVDKVKRFIEMEFSKHFTVLRLEFWRFNTALKVLRRNRGEWIRLGTRFDSEDPDTIEWQIQNRARQIHPNRRVDLKSAPHVCDMLVLSGIAEYGRAVNPKTGRENQAIRLVES